VTNLLIISDLTDEYGDALYRVTDETGTALEFSNDGDVFYYSELRFAEAALAELQGAAK
jgi:hypothetical protein